MTVGSERETSETRTQKKTRDGYIGLRLIDPKIGRVTEERIYQKFV